MWWTSSGPSARRSARVGVHIRERGLLRDAKGAVHLDRLVDDLGDPDRHHGFSHMNPDAGLLVAAQNVHGFGGLEHYQAHGLYLDAGAADDLDIAAELHERLAGEHEASIGDDSVRTISREQTELVLAEVRQREMARAVGRPIPGVNAFSVPVFDQSGSLALVISHP
jgi:hypothetical protein